MVATKFRYAILNKIEGKERGLIGMTYSINWDLETIFPGGSDSVQLKERMSQLEEQIANYRTTVDAWSPNSEDDAAKLGELLDLSATINQGFSQCGSFINALLSANVNDSKAKILTGDLYAKLPALQAAQTVFSKKLTEISEDDWTALVKAENLASVAFRLSEIRRDGKELLSEAEETIINTLNLDGLNAWSQHYDTIVASIEIPFLQEDGTTIKL